MDRVADLLARLKPRSRAAPPDRRIRRRNHEAQHLAGNREQSAGCRGWRPAPAAGPARVRCAGSTRMQHVERWSRNGCPCWRAKGTGTCGSCSLGSAEPGVEAGGPVLSWRARLSTAGRWTRQTAPKYVNPSTRCPAPSIATRGHSGCRCPWRFRNSWAFPRVTRSCWDCAARSGRPLFASAGDGRAARRSTRRHGRRSPSCWVPLSGRPEAQQDGRSRR